jgi:uncharacterized repeat protein (TIGR01451 family)
MSVTDHHEHHASQDEPHESGPGRGRRRLRWLWWLPLPLVALLQWWFPGAASSLVAGSCPTCGVCGGGTCTSVLGAGHAAHLVAAVVAWFAAGLATLRAWWGSAWGGGHGRRRLAVGVAVVAMGVVVSGDLMFPEVDLPGPPARFEVVRAGSLVIAMDNTHQALIAPFNTRAYGLAIELLNADIPLKWVIRAGKGKDGVDLSARTVRVAPSLDATPTLRDFRAGPLVVPRYFAPQAMTVVQAFNARGGNVAVFELLDDELVDVRYDIAFKPRVLVGDSNTDIHTSILANAWVPTTNYTSATISAATIGGFTCASLVTEPHNTATVGIAAVANFLASGGNFLAQCASVNTYENHPSGGFQTTGGITISNVSTVLAYPNPDLAISQFDGVLETAPGGSEQDWFLNVGSVFRNLGHAIAQNTGISSNRFALTASKLYGDAGGMAFYLGGHEYKGTDIGSINGHRVLLNAMLIPATRDVTCQIRVALPTDIGVTKTVDRERAMYGDTVTFTVTVALGGPGNASGVEVVDQLPSGYAYVGHVASHGGYDPVSGTWSIGGMSWSDPTLPTTATLTISAEVLEGGAYRNTATVTSSEADADLADNVASAEPIVFGPGDVDLALVKTVNVTDPEPGTLITYTLTVDNAGPSVATNLVVVDALPAGVTFVSASSGCSSAGGVVTCAAPTLNAGAQRSFQVTVRVDASPGSVLTNAASVSADEHDYDLADNTASVDVTVSVVRCPVGFEPVAQAGWAVSAQVIAATVDNAANAVGALAAAGATAGATNSARLRAGGVLQVDLGTVVPGGTELILSLASRPASRFGVQASLTGTAASFVSLGTFGGGGTLGQSPTDDQLVRVPVTVPSGGARYLRFAREAGDRNYVDGVAFAFVCGVEVARADLSLTKTPSIDGPEPGDLVTYALVVTNVGPRDATGVQVTDTLPAGLTYVSASAECFVLGATLTCAVPALPIGASVTFVLSVEVDDLPLGTVVVNDARVAADQEDPVTSNDVASVPITVSGLELRKAVCNVTASAGCANPSDFAASVPGLPGDVLEYRVTFERFGPPVFDLELVDDVPPEAEFVVDAYGLGQDVGVACPDGSMAFLTTGATSAVAFDLADLCVLGTATRADAATVSEALLHGQVGEFRFRVTIP